MVIAKMSLPELSQSQPKSHPSQIPCLVILVFMGFAGIILFVASIAFPSSFFGKILSPGRQAFGDFQINDNFTSIQNDAGKSWEIVYERKVSSQFSGKVRHISAIKLAEFPILTHDILVTTQDFADPSKVSTSVADHHFVWLALTEDRPRGSIHLLHTVPKDDVIFQQLSQINPNQMVTISGWEITRINALKPDGSVGQWWQDAGCNTLLVDTVIIQPDP